MTLSALCLVAVIAGSPGLFAQTFPQKPIKLVTAGAPGSLPDTIVRPLAEKMSERLGQPVVVENRPGAGGLIAMSVVAKVETGRLHYRHWLTERRWSTTAICSRTELRSLAGLHAGHQSGRGSRRSRRASIRSSELAGRVHRVRAKAARRNPLRDSAGGSPPHVLALRLSAAARIEMVAVPYRGSNEALAAVLAGEVPVAFDSPRGGCAACQCRQAEGPGSDRTRAIQGSPGNAHAGRMWVCRLCDRSLARPRRADRRSTGNHRSS